MRLTCKQCGAPMKKVTLSSGNCLGILVALIVFFAGLFIAIFFLVTIIGPIIGALMMLAALFLSNRIIQQVMAMSVCFSLTYRQKTRMAHISV